MNTKDKGDLTESAVLFALLRAGEKPLLPFGDNQRYDIGLDRDGILVRVQCKTGKYHSGKGVVEFSTCSSYSHRGGKSKGYSGQVDFFGVFCPDLNEVYLVPIEEVGGKMATLRVRPSKNGQLEGVRFASEYKIVP